jgi:enoyl-CoA hydratase/carnithine racemase
MGNFILFERRDRVAVLTMNHPETLNSLYDGGPLEDLCEALSRLQADRDLSVAILTGAGRAFSSGADLKKIAADGGLASLPHLKVRDFYKSGIVRIVENFEALELPIIAAINGPAFGAGFGLACLCDIRIASENATFCEPFVKLGLVPADGNAWLMPRLIGAAAYAELLYTADPIAANVAEQRGVVNKVVPHGGLLVETLALAKRIAANAPQALRMAKRLMHEGRRGDLKSNLELAATMQALLHRSDDHREALNAFLEKRAPRFTNT